MKPGDAWTEGVSWQDGVYGVKLIGDRGELMNEDKKYGSEVYLLDDRMKAVGRRTSGSTLGTRRSSLPGTDLDAVDILAAMKNFRYQDYAVGTRLTHWGHH